MRSRAGPVRGCAALLVGAAIATSCDGPGPSPPAPSPRPPTAGTIRLGYPEEPPTLNPVTERAPAAAEILRAVLPSFFVVTPDLEYRPYLLAGEPTVRTDGDRMLVDFRIRSARWSDGRPITVDDVAFTARVMSDPAIDAASPEGFDHLVEVRERSATEGTLVLSPPLASWRELFSAGRFVLPAHAAEGPADVVAWDTGPPVTAGPFDLGRWTRGRSIELVANRRFFGPRPLARRLVVEIVADPTTAVQLLESGRLDVLAPMLGVRLGERLRAIEGVAASSAFGPRMVVLVVNARSLPAAGARRRLLDAVDRERFVDVVLGDGGRMAPSVVAPEQPGTVPAWSRFGTDAPLLVETRDELTLVHQHGELLALAGRYVWSEIEDAGGDVELIPVESDVLWELFLAERSYDLALVEVRTGRFPDLSAWVRAAGGSAPLTELDDPALARLLSSVDRSGTEAPALARAQRRLARLSVVLPLFQPEVTAVWRDGVSGVEANPSIDGILWNSWDWAIRR